MGIRGGITDPIRPGGQIGNLSPLHCFPGLSIVRGPFHEGGNPGNAPIIGSCRCCISVFKSLRHSLGSSDNHGLEIIEVHGGIGITVDTEQLANQLVAACMAEVVIGGDLSIIDINGILLGIPVGHHLDVIPVIELEVHELIFGGTVLHQNFAHIKSGNQGIIAGAAVIPHHGAIGVLEAGV